jgi:hypothetical protein
MRKKFLQYYEIFCDLSLDVVLGVLANMLAINFCFQLEMPLIWFLGLPTATWAVYLSDHLLDLKRSNHQLSSRHDYVKRHLPYIKPLVLGLYAFCFILISFFADIKIILAALTSVVFCLGYMFVTFKLNPKYQWLYNKELLVAFVYATAIYSTTAFTVFPLNDWIWFYLELFCLAYINLLLMSIIERDKDIAQERFSWSVVLGEKRSVRLFYTVVSISLCFCVWLGMSSRHDMFLYLSGSYFLITLGHVFIFIYRQNLQQHEYYRKIGELLFLIPLFSFHGR